MQIQNNGFSIAQLSDQYVGKPQGAQVRRSLETTDGLSFEELLRQKELQGTGGLKFSKHAMGRLADRRIELSGSQLERLESGTRKAGEKGIRDSLVIVDQLAFIVNIPNHTVVTAMDSTEAQGNIFTNINGAVII